MKDFPAPPGDVRQGDRPQAARLVGREHERERISAFLAAASANGGALFVTGEPGVGKTQLLDAAALIAEADGTRVVRAAGIQFEAEMSYAGLNQVLLPLLGGIPRLPAVQRDALNVALGLGEGTPPNRLVVSNATLGLLSQAAVDRPLLLILDDLPWFDRASAGVLSFVARRLDGSRVGLLGASRADEEDLFDHAGVPDLVAEPLDDIASRQLLDIRYPDMAPAVRDRVLTEAEGNPLALVELPAALGPGRRASSRHLPSSLPLGSRLQALFSTRINGLPRETRRLLLRLALDGTGDVRVLGAGAEPNAGLHHLAAAETARIAHLDERTHRTAFHHPLIRSTVVEMSNVEERRDAHWRLAEVWADQPDRRAWHLAEATIEPDESVASELEAAATRILARGDVVGCVRALSRASELSPGTAERRRRMAAAAYIGAEVAGDLDNASQVLVELRHGGTGFEGSLQAAIAASVFLLQGDGDVATAHRVLVGALESREGVLDASEPVVAEALYSLMMVCGYVSDEERWQSFEEAMARSVGIPVAIDLSRKLLADPTHAPPADLETLETVISTLGDEADPTQIMRIALAATYVDRIEGCRAALWRIVDDARRGGAIASGITAMIVLARDDLEAGEWEEAEQLAEEAVRVGNAHGYDLVIWSARFQQGLIAAARGEDEHAKGFTDDVMRWTAPRGIRAGDWFVHQVRGLVALGRGDFEEAYRLATMISPPGLLAPHNPGALAVLMDVVDAAVRTGRRREAEAHVAAMQEKNLAQLSSRLALVVGTCRAIVAPNDEALDLFEETLALPGIERWRFHLARARLAYGERLRRSRAMTKARVQLNAAVEIFENLRARPWVERATAELRATGQTKPHAGESVLDRLTPQEFEIVTLAASGLTNKQIAERLFLSHRTVGGHLHRAFPKLGVATRAALRDALASLPAEGHPRT